MLRIGKVKFGGEIGTRPAVILEKNGGTAKVMKITTKARFGEDEYKFRLSGMNGVRGYVVADRVYTVPVNKIEKMTCTLFDCEERGIQKKKEELIEKGVLKNIRII